MMVKESPYPTMEEVNAADKDMIKLWYQLLPPVGYYATGTQEYTEAFERELMVMGRIVERFKELHCAHEPTLEERHGWVPLDEEETYHGE